MRRILALSLFVALVGTEGHAQPAAPAAAAAPKGSKGEALARLVSSTENILELEVATARRAFFDAIGRDADFGAAEKQYPGLSDAVWKAMEPELRRALAEDAPRFAKRLAAIYDANLNPAEQDALLVFYASPTGQKMIRGMYAGMDGTPIVAAAMKDPDAPVSVEALAALTESGKRAAAGTLDPGDQPALEALARAMSLEKLTAIGKQVQSATAEWVNEPDPEGDARMEKIVTAAVERHMAAARKRR